MYRRAQPCDSVKELEIIHIWVRLLKRMGAAPELWLETTQSGGEQEQTPAQVPPADRPATRTRIDPLAGSAIKYLHQIKAWTKANHTSIIISCFSSVYARRDGIYQIFKLFLFALLLFPCFSANCILSKFSGLCSFFFVRLTSIKP